MATFSIYSKNGQKVRHSGEPQYSGSYMGVDYIEFRSVCSPAPIDWERGDYVDYYRTGLRYKLYSLPMPKKIARRGEYGAAFEYNNVQFYSAAKELEIAPFRDIVAEDNNIHFSTRQDISTYEDVYGIARRIQACMDDIFPNRWRIEVFETEDEDLNALLTEVKEFALSNASCFDALSHIYNTWKNVGWIHTYDEAADVDVITIGRANVRDGSNTSDSYSYGMGKGLTSIKKASANEGEFATRLYVYGSERNIQTRYYNKHNILHKDSVDIRNLMLPIEKWGKTDGLPDASKAFLQADNATIEKYGLIPRTVYFDGTNNEEIYPSITGLTMAQVRQEMIKAGEASSEYLPEGYDYRIDQIGVLVTNLDGGSKEEVEKQRTVDVSLHEVGFNIAEQGKLTSEGYAIISMTSGACAGREFKVTKYVGRAYGNEAYGSRIYRIERAWDESLGEGFPNKNYPIKSGDTFVLLDIPMPEFYITMAENRLYEAAEKMLADYTRVSAFYEPGIDSIRIKEGGKLLRAGMYMQVYDEDIIDTADNRDYVLIDSITIDEKAALPSYKITLREQKRSSRTYSTLEDMIVDAKEEAREAIKRERQYTERRFRSAQETLDMIAGAFDDFSDGIDPVTIKTMAALIGHETLQFKFTSSIDSLDEIPCPLSYDENTKQMIGNAAALVHMTLGVDDVTVKSSRSTESYKRWNIAELNSASLDDADVAYYVYVKASKGSQSATYYLSEEPMEMDDSSESSYYFLVGILNSENAGTRDFVTLYGFTEILPGQITTDIIRSADGQTYFDLANNEIGGVIKFKAGSEGLENVMGDLNIGGQNMLRNSGFTGDYLSERLADDKVLDAAQQMFNSPTAHWSVAGAEVVEDSEAASGYAVALYDKGTLEQTLYQTTINGESYVVSFKAKGHGAVEVMVGNDLKSIEFDSDEYVKCTATIVPQYNDTAFWFEAQCNCTICDLQLERGSIATSWGNSPFDNTSDRVYYQTLKYIQDALKETTVIDGGLILSSLIKLGQTTNNVFVENAGLNGIYNEEDTPAFWAGGSIEEAENLISYINDNPSKELSEEELANSAKVVITHGGKAILNDAIIRGTAYANEGKIGSFTIEEGNLKSTEVVHVIGPAGPTSFYTYDFSLGREGLQLYIDGEYLGGINKNGFIDGLRYEPYYAYSGIQDITFRQRTIFASETNTEIWLPAEPKGGEEHIILASDPDVTIYGNGHKIYCFSTGSESDSIRCGDLADRIEARVYFNAEQAKWWMTTSKQ